MGQYPSRMTIGAIEWPKWGAFLLGGFDPKAADAKLSLGRFVERRNEQNDKNHRQFGFPHMPRRRGLCAIDNPLFRTFATFLMGWGRHRRPRKT